MADTVEQRPEVPKLLVEGTELSGWRSLVITRGLQSFAPVFTFRVDNPSPDVALQNECEVLLKTDLGLDCVATGHITKVRTTYDGKRPLVTPLVTAVSGRGKAGKLLKSRARRPGHSGEWLNATPEAIVRDIARPFGVSVSVDISTSGLNDPLPRFRLHPGELAAAAILRCAAYRRLLVTSEVGGDLSLTEASRTRISTGLVRGKNVLAGEYSHADEALHSHYIGETQTQLNNGGLHDSVNISRTLEDHAIEHYSPTQVPVDFDPSRSTLRHYLEWYMNRQRGMAEMYSYVVDGWRHAQGVWMPNTIVDVEDDQLLPHGNRELLITQVENRLSGRTGTTTRLTLMPPEAFLPGPLPAPMQASLQGEYYAAG